MDGPYLARRFSDETNSTHKSQYQHKDTKKNTLKFVSEMKNIGEEVNF